MANTDCVVFDFDGTLTDAEAHAPAFFQESRARVGDLLQLGEEELSKVWAEQEAYVRNEGPEFGWVNEGLVVAPAHSDPYLVANSTTARIFSHYKPGISEQALAEMVYKVHSYAYERVAPAFRPDAESTLNQVLQHVPHVFVATNSGTDRVRARLDAYAPDLVGRIHVYGNARKFVVGPGPNADARFFALPESTHLDGLKREVWLRRGHYYDALSAIWKTTATIPENTLVCGDNFELDLVMPLALGCAAHLVTRLSTLPHERAAAQNTRRCSTSADLQSILTHL